MIYDTFIFDNEVALLEHRLAETFDQIDVFVLVEAAETFQGRPKPLNFAAIQDRFAWAKGKLRHIALPRLPGDSTWEREAFQRNAIQLGLYGAKPQDIILLLDADEIPSQSVLKRLREDGLSRPHRLLMTRHYGSFDMLAPRSACCASPLDPFPFAVPHLRPGSWSDLAPDWWCMPGVAVRFQDISGSTAEALPSRTPNLLRRSNNSAPRLPEAGRHLSSIATAEDLQTKLSHFSHAEHADERSLSLAHLRRARQFGVHARGWWYAERPANQLPSDLERLGHKLTPANNQLPPSFWRRRLVRSWAWVRHLKWVPKRLVSLVDQHFERLRLVLLPLLLADYICEISARLQKSKSVRLETTH